MTDIPTPRADVAAWNVDEDGNLLIAVRWIVQQAGAGMPDPKEYTDAELFVAGGISTLPEFAGRNPVWCLPIARRALEALGEWDPDDSHDHEWRGWGNTDGGPLPCDVVVRPIPGKTNPFPCPGRIVDGVCSHIHYHPEKGTPDA